MFTSQWLVTDFILATIVVHCRVIVTALGGYGVLLSLAHLLRLNLQ
jgi:hypothetical protein